MITVLVSCVCVRLCARGTDLHHQASKACSPSFLQQLWSEVELTRCNVCELASGGLLVAHTHARTHTGEHEAPAQQAKGHETS